MSLDVISFAAAQRAEPREIGYAEHISNSTHAGDMFTPSQMKQLGLLQCTVDVAGPRPVFVEAFVASLDNDTIGKGGGILIYGDSQYGTRYAFARVVSPVAGGGGMVIAKPRLVLAPGEYTFSVFFARWLAGGNVTAVASRTTPAYLRVTQ